MVQIKNSFSTASFLYCLLGGFLYALGFPNIVTQVLVPAPLIAAYILINRNTFFREGRVSYSLRRDFLFLLCFSLSAYLTGYYWIPHTLKEFGAIPFPLNQLLGLLYCFIIFPQYMAFLICLRFIKRFRKYFPCSHSQHIYFNLFFASLLTLLEIIIPQVFETHLGHSWLSLAPHIGLAPIFGKAIFSFISYYFIFFILKLKNENRFEFLPISLFIIFILANFLLPLKFDQNGADKINLRIVQGNVGNYMKLDSEKGGFSSLSDILNRYKDLSTKKTMMNPDLIIWPETSYPNMLSSDSFSRNPKLIPSFFTQIQESQQSDLFFGGYDSVKTKGNSSSQSFETDYNTSFFFKYDKNKNILANWYHKIKLIPFGETLPFGPFNNFLSQYITNISYFKKGSRMPLFKTRKNAKFIASICYEILNPHFTRDYLNANKEQPNFIINLTNDSWYGDTIEPHQHLYLSHWRAIEFQLPIIRSTNTGISSVLYPDGSESTRTKIFQEDYLDIALPVIEREATPYQKWGYIPLILFCLFLAALIKLKAFLKNVMKANDP